MALGDIPSWVQTVGPLVGTTIVGGLITLAEKRKHPKPPENDHAAIVEASIVSDKGIDTIAKVIRDFGESYHDDTRRHREAMEDLCRQIRQLEGAVREGLPPVAGLDDMLRRLVETK